MKNKPLVRFINPYICPQCKSELSLIKYNSIRGNGGLNSPIDFMEILYCNNCGNEYTSIQVIDENNDIKYTIDRQSAEYNISEKRKELSKGKETNPRNNPFYDN